jgi:hypothetical protein
MNNFEAAGDTQYFPGGERLVGGYRLHLLIGMVEQLAQHAPQQTRCPSQRAKRTSTFGHRDIDDDQGGRE